MSHHIARVSHEQGALFPLHLDDFVRPDHLVRVIAAYVDRVDVRQLGFANAVPPERGRPSYAPQDLLKLYVYAYINGLQSSRRMETECERNVELLWLMGRLKPDHKTIAVFRQGNEPAIKGVCAAFVQFCREQGQLVSRQVAVDGTKLRAAASPRRLAMAKQLEKKLKELEERIARFLKLLDENDKSEQTEADLGGDLDWVRAALERLRTQKGELEGLKKAVEASGREGLVTNEAEARAMQCTGKAAAVPAYNAQFAVSTDTHLIVHHALTQDVNDRQQLAAMADGAREALGLAVPPAGDGQDLPQPQMQVLADAGYSSAEQAAQCEARGIEPATFDRIDVAGRAVLFHTGWSRHFATPAYGVDAPFLTRAAAEALVERKARLVGIDSVNIDDMADLTRPAHSLLLRAGIPIVEHLAALDSLPTSGFRFFAAVAKFRGIGTFPVRAFAIV